MAVVVSATGTAELRKLAAQLRKAEYADLAKKLREAQQKAVKPLEREIKDSAAAMLPHRGGYAAIMSAAVRITTYVGVTSGSLKVKVWAPTKTGHRDVARVNAGELRHPTFGRRMLRSDWHSTWVTRGFVDRPANLLADRILQEADRAVQEIIDEIARG